MKKIILLFLPLILFACGKTENKKITIVLDWVPNTNHTGLFVAKDKGYFKDEGLNVEIVQPPEGSTTGLIGAGGAEFGISFQDTLARTFQKKDRLPVTAVATIIQHNTSGLISLKKSKINRPKALENKVYGTWDDPIEQAMIKKLVEDDGGDFSKVTLIPYSWDVEKALNTNTDATWVYYAWDGIAAKVKGLETNYLPVRDYSEDLDFYTPVIIANNSYLDNNKEEAKAVLRAIKKGYIFAINNPEESAKILVNNSPELDENMVIESQKWINNEYISDVDRWGYIDKDRWNRFYDWLDNNNLIENKIPANFGFSNEYLPE